MRTINFSDARRQFKEVLDRVVDDGDITIITRRDADDVVLMSLSEYNSWKETENLLASPANARHLRESIAQANAGRVVYRDLIDPPAPLRVQEPRAEYAVRKKPKAEGRKKRG
jgi:antitoxin YefM